MRRRELIALCFSLLFVWAIVKADQKTKMPTRQWVEQMANYCEDLADAFERLESYHKNLAREFREAKDKKMAELHERLADENDRVADQINELQRAYERLSKELKR